MGWTKAVREGQTEASSVFGDFFQNGEEKTANSYVRPNQTKPRSPYLWVSPKII